ncbi:hypothetical protein [Microbacterium sp. 2FI]|uniref:hypothetical protein n=1 Tax=Microbacterium sp. 2FI TaxID=2502193 RepID=UPI0010F7542B|nr:hypothetical protein [Microbacterium sp. 2FI]
MSAGPIKAERDGHLMPLVSTPDTHRVCGSGAPGRAYCGRKADKVTTSDWSEVVCSDCTAARRADEAVA